MDVFAKLLIRLSYCPNVCLTTFSTSVSEDDMSIASPSSLNPRNKAQYVAYTFPIADARENDFLVTAEAPELNPLNELVMLFAAVPAAPPVRDNFANAFVMSIIFRLTLGAFDSSDISCRIAVASFGIFSIALVELW